MKSIRASFRDYESWLRRQLGGRFVAADLKHKHALMRGDLFAFLRGTCWRWAETARAVCPDLAGAPEIESVGDSHVGNFGLWRDGEGRLVWGVNDYDEAAPAPWPLDLVRLAASALLACAHRDEAGAVADAILHGYRRGIETPRPFVLQQKRLWLRDLFAANRKQRGTFWDEILSVPADPDPDPGFTAALVESLPEAGIRAKFARRQAGVGSLGRLRLVASARHWRGGPVAREAKAALPSCWDRKARAGAGYALASGRYRAPDPWLRFEGGAIIRRLAPDSRKLELRAEKGHVRHRLLRAMGRDIAAVHAADAAQIAAVGADFHRRPPDWLARAAQAAVEATERDWKDWR